MEHPGVNFGVYLKREARLPKSAPSPDVRRPALVVGFRGLSAGRYVFDPQPTRPDGTQSASDSDCSCCGSTARISTGEVKLTSCRCVGSARYRFQHVFGSSGLGAAGDGCPPDVPAAGRSICSSDGRAGFSDQPERLGAEIVGAHTPECVSDLGWRDGDGLVAPVETLDDRQADRGCANDRRPRQRRWGLPRLDTCGGARPLARVLHVPHGCRERRGRGDRSIGASLRRRQACGSATPRSCRSVPCANTNIPTIMVGEKVAATILSGA